MLYPLKFQPYLKYYPYGGRRFAEVLHKEGVPPDRDVAESWEIADHGQEQSVVSNGPLAGQTLRELMERFQAELVGEEVYSRYGDYFPLLLKFLDCDKRLPAHMHPNDEQAKRIGLKDPGKTEAWYIVRADPGAFAYCGALPGLTPEKFRSAIQRCDTYDGVMKKTPTTSGETYFVPAGRLHGLDAGSLAFEIQQNSDAGFGWD
jgi:mannose-6-phosphate isomerase